MTDSTVAERAAALRPQGEKIRAVLIAEVEKLGLAEPLPLPAWEEGQFELQRDPASGKESLAVLWKNARGHLQGSILLHADGSFFAEYDVVRPHPKKTKWFVEAVTAWGRDDTIKSEARLLPMPE